MTIDTSSHSVTQSDHDAIERAAKQAESLVQDLQQVNRSIDPLVSDFALELLTLAASINAQLHRLLINIK